MPSQQMQRPTCMKGRLKCGAGSCGSSRQLQWQGLGPWAKRASGGHPRLWHKAENPGDTPLVQDQVALR